MGKDKKKDKLAEKDGEEKKDEYDMGDDTNVKEKVQPFELVELLLDKNGYDEKLLNEWYDKVEELSPSYDSFLANAAMNRDTDVLCYERTRVVVRNGAGTDYIHASYVDSYENTGGFVLAQSPFSRATEEQWWAMVAQIKPPLIVVMSEAAKKGDKNEWKPEQPYSGGAVSTNPGQSKSSGQWSECDVVVTTKTTFTCKLVQYKSWPDESSIPNDIIEFVKQVKPMSKPADGPTLIVSPDGGTRVGVFAAVDIILDRIEAEKKVGYRETIQLLATQRYGAFAKTETYSQLYEIVRKHLGGEAKPKKVATEASEEKEKEDEKE